MSELIVAVVCTALQGAGLRVLFPMFADPKAFGRWLDLAAARAVLWSAHEVRDLAGTESDRELLSELERAARTRGIPTVCLHEDLDLPARVFQRSHSAFCLPSERRIQHIAP